MLFSTYCNRKHILSFFVHRQTLNIPFTNFLARIFSVRLSTKLSRTLPECWSSLELHSFKFPDDYTKFTYLNFSSVHFLCNCSDQFVCLLLPLWQICHLFSDIWWTVSKYGLSFIILTRDTKICPEGNFDRLISIQVTKNL